MIEIVVIGTGMYSIGRGTDGFGTIVPAVCEWAKNVKARVRIHLVGSQGKNNHHIQEKIEAFKKLSATKVDFELWPRQPEVNPTEYDRVLDGLSKPLCCIVAVPDDLHFAVAQNAIKRKIPTLVVKPLTPTCDQASSLIKMADEYNTYGCVEFHKRFDAANLMLLDYLQSGELGELLYSVVEYSQRIVIPTKIFRGWVESSNIFQYLGVHYVDIMKFISGAYPVRLSATGQKTELYQQGINTPDSIQCSIEWELPDNASTFIQTLHLNWIDPETSPAMSNQRIKLIGTKGRVESDQSYRGLSVYSAKTGFTTPNPYFCTQFGHKDGHVHWAGYGIDSITTFCDDCMDLNLGSVTKEALDLKRSSFRESFCSTAVVEACNASLEKGGDWVPVKSERTI